MSRLLHPAIHRRAVLQAMAGLCATAPLPRIARAAPTSTSEQKFLFIFCEGGWDILKVFAPKPDHETIVDDGATTAYTEGGLTWGSSGRRSSVDTFFQTWGSQAAILNGVEVRSITHERCTRIAMTGRGAVGYDDWATLIAGSSSQDLLMPHLVLSGPAFAAEHTAAVVRAGDGLNGLLDGTNFTQAEPAIMPLGSTVESLTDDYVRRRVEQAYTAETNAGRQELLGLYGEALEAATRLSEEGDLELSGDSDGCHMDLASEAGVVFDAMERGLTRTGMIASRGQCGIGWDTHTDDETQDLHYSGLFTYLSQLMSDLQDRTSPSGAPLAEELTVVVMSEMGRHPMLNGAGGRDHWTYTSMLLLGAGVKGGQVVGGLDDNFIGETIDLTTGSLEGTSALVPKHLGATLLTLAGLDPREHVPDVEPILGLLS